jgi:thiol-disulfide isomerase/thioredoxin
MQPQRRGVLRILLAVATISSAAAQDALDVLRKTAATYRRPYSIEGADTLEKIVRGNARTTVRRFHAYRLDTAMRVDFDDGGVRLTDGKTEWNRTASGQPYSKKPVPWDSRGRRALHEFFYSYDGIAEFVKSADFVVPPGKDGFLIEVTYSLPGGLASEVIKNFWIDADYIVQREVSHPAAIVEPPTAGPVKLTRTINFGKVQLNPALEPSLFTFRPPEEPGPSGTAPDFALTDLAGARFSLVDLRGKTVLLYFWASWCATCRDEMPRLEKLAREHQDRGLVLVGINDEEPEIASAYLKAGGHTLRSLVDRWQDVYKKFAIQAIPTVLLISKDGRIVSGYGYGEDAALAAGLQKAGIESR